MSECLGCTAKDAEIVRLNERIDRLLFERPGSVSGPTAMEVMQEEADDEPPASDAIHQSAIMAQLERCTAPDYAIEIPSGDEAA